MSLHISYVKYVIKYFQVSIIYMEYNEEYNQKVLQSLSNAFSLTDVKSRRNQKPDGGSLGKHFASKAFKRY